MGRGGGVGTLDRYLYTCIYSRVLGSDMHSPDHQMSVHIAGLDLSDPQGSWVS